MSPSRVKMEVNARNMEKTFRVNVLTTTKEKHVKVAGILRVPDMIVDFQSTYYCLGNAMKRNFIRIII